MWKKIKSLVARSKISKFVDEDLTEVNDQMKDQGFAQTSDAAGAIEEDDDVYKILEIERNQPIEWFVRCK